MPPDGEHHASAAAGILLRAITHGSAKAPADIYIETLALMEDGFVPEVVLSRLRELADECGLEVGDEPHDAGLGAPLQLRVSFRRKATA